MIEKYKLATHQKHPHLSFAYVDGDHKSDFAMHRHDFSELFIVVSGRGIHNVAKHQYSLQPGDVFVINGDIEHGFQDVEELKLINLMFDAQNPFFESSSMRRLAGYQALFKIEPFARQSSEYQAKLTLKREELKTIIRLLEQIRNEYERAEAGFEIMISGAMQQLVIHLARIYQNQQGALPTTTLALGRAIAYIELNFQNIEISSEQIAKHAFISKRQLERLFRQFFNTSPTKYVRALQLNFSQTLLLSEDKCSIQSIAEQSGFGDSNYFSKCFKNTFDITPKQFRAQYRHNSG
ncbi:MULTISPECIES: helix-turn-helix domain-containing protein [unclassified Vibrio]|uniref:helix-turn-helix domain-containing protein n=1 Tax=unclassified Vibrio TaxID=2614977 RepID=UPI001F2C5C54|nr:MULTISPECIES: helix-turn-helix domain-containing protein [unclassified Vibrio]QXL80359.1 HTH-type transcriptional activator RhaR [Vibrio sp.]